MLSHISLTDSFINASVSLISADVIGTTPFLCIFISIRVFREVVNSLFIAISLPVTAVYFQFMRLSGSLPVYSLEPAIINGSSFMKRLTRISPTGSLNDSTAFSPSAPTGRTVMLIPTLKPLETLTRPSISVAVTTVSSKENTPRFIHFIFLTLVHLLRGFSEKTPGIKVLSPPLVCAAESFLLNASQREAESSVFIHGKATKRRFSTTSVSSRVSPS